MIACGSFSAIVSDRSERRGELVTHIPSSSRLRDRDRLRTGSIALSASSFGGTLSLSVIIRLELRKTQDFQRAGIGETQFVYLAVNIPFQCK